MKTFDQYLAETGRQSELDDLRRTGRYGAAKSAYESGSYGSGNSGFGSILDQVKNSVMGALNPVIDQIKSQAPKVTEAYQGARNTLQTQKASLAGKYQQLLADIKNSGIRQTEGTTRTVNNELARRGITSDSTAARQELSANLTPIEDATLSRTSQATTLQGEEENALANAIAQLSISEQDAQTGLLDRVANLLSGGISQSTGIAGNLYSQELAQRQTESQKMYQDLQNQLLNQQLSSAKASQPIELQMLQAQLNKLLRPPSTSSGGLSSINLDSLWD